MSEETNVEASAEEVSAEAPAVAGTAPNASGTPVAIPKKKKKKWPIVLGVLAVVIIAAGAGFWVWHEQPSFCNAICHTPMDPYNATYDQEPNTTGMDKWGDEVENTNAMMVVVHKEAGTECMDCHVPTISEQVNEGVHWVTGDYLYPLEERNLEQLVAYRDVPADEFCLNENCHNMTRNDLLEATSEYDRNPHRPQHGKRECSDCHKAHRASVNACSDCHEDAPIPEGWLTMDEAKELSPAIPEA